MGGSVGNTIGRAGLAGITGGLSEFGRKDPFGAPINNPLHSPINDAAHSLGFNLFGDPLNGGGGQSISGPFRLDQAQFDADRAAIGAEGQKQYDATNTLGQNQYNQSLQGISDLGTANNQRVKDIMAQSLPGIAENAQAAHLYDSTGYGQEVGRQQANLASQVANQEAQLKLGALGQLQGSQQNALGIQNSYGQAGLGRGLSLEDFINQANVAKTIGAQTAPQVGNGKGNTGTALSGAGSALQGVASVAKLAK